MLETVPEESTRLLRLEKGDLDVAAVGTTQLADLEQRIKDQKLPLFVTKADKKGQPLLSLSTQWINLNNKMLPTSDINVRRALVHSFNYDLYIQKVMKGYAFRMTGMVPKGVPGNVADYPLWPYDLKKAKEFLDKASPEAKQELAKGLKLPVPAGRRPPEGRRPHVAGRPGHHRHQADSRGSGRRDALEPPDLGPRPADRRGALVRRTSPTRTTSRTRRGPSTGPAPRPWATARPSRATPRRTT